MMARRVRVRVRVRVTLTVTARSEGAARSDGFKDLDEATLI